MKIAVTYENGKVFQHFGHTEQFKIYDVEGQNIKSAKVLDSNGSGHGALAGLLAEQGIEVLICGGIGGGAMQALDEAGIHVFGGVQGDTDECVKDFLSNRLQYDPDVRCSHHDHEHGEEGHTCGSHGCGSHGCGGGCSH